MLLIRLAWFCVTDPGFRWYSAVHGPKSDPKFFQFPDQTVTSTQQVAALPPFAIGIKVPRYMKTADSVAAELLLEGIDGTLVAGKTVSVKLLRRRWISQLQASDFSDGSAGDWTIDNPITGGLTATWGLVGKGKIAVKLGLHRGLLGLLPFWLINSLLSVRSVLLRVVKPFMSGSFAPFLRRV